MRDTDAEAAADAGPRRTFRVRFATGATTFAVAHDATYRHTGEMWLAACDIACSLTNDHATAEDAAADAARERGRLLWTRVISLEPVSEHCYAVALALDAARVALASARARGRRAGCLADAVRAIEGALRCVEAEDGGEV